MIGKRHQPFTIAILIGLLFAAPLHADCVNPVGPEGQTIYNGDYHTLQFCNGTNWIAMGATSGASETDPKVSTLTAGKWCAANGGGTAIVCTSDAPSSSQWTTSGSDIYYVTGKVGIGTATPTSALTVIGSVDTSVQFLGQASDSASVPSFSWTGDTNTGMWSPGADTIAFTTNGSEAMRIDSSNNVAIGTTTMTGALNVQKNSTATNAIVYGFYANGAQSTANTLGYESIYVAPTYTAASGNTLLYLRGIMTAPANSSSGSINSVYGIGAYPSNASTGTVASLFALFGNPVKSGTGPVTGMYGVYSRCDNSNATGTVTNCYGLYIDTPTTTGAITNKWGVYQKDASTNNYFAGSVGIATTSMTYGLNVSGVIQIVDSASGIYGNAGTTGSLLIAADSGGASNAATVALYGRTSANDGKIVYRASTNLNDTTSVHAFQKVNSSGTGTTLGYFMANGNFVVVGSGTTCTIGNGTGNTSCSSDERLKGDVHPLENSLERILKLQGVTFHWKKAQERGPERIGLIAQDVEKVYPQLVTTGDDGYRQLNYAGLVAPLIEAVKELKAVNDNQAAEIALLKAANSNTAQEMTKLRASISALAK
jgi:hypothetical protein